MRNTGVDVARIIACFAVIVLHLVGRDAGPICAIAYFSAGFAIPVFFIASGYFVLQKESIGPSYAATKAKRIFPIVFFWVCLACLIFSITRGTIYNPLIEFPLASLQMGLCGLYWFFFALFAVYCAVSTASRSCVNSTKRIALMTTLFGLICLAIDHLSYVSLRQGGAPLQSHVPQTLRLWTWLFYFFLGGLVGRKEVRSRLYRHRVLVYCLLALSYVGVLVWDYCLGYLKTGNVLAEHYYDNLFTMLYSVSLFCTCDFAFNGHRDSVHVKAIGSISGCTMGIYILHFFVIRFVKSFYSLDIVGINLLLPPATFLICLAVTVLMKRQRILSRLVSLS